MTNVSRAWIAAGLLAMSAVAAAVETLPAHFEACVALKRDSERLACYDKAVSLLQAGGESTPAPTAENMFGANQDIAAPKSVTSEVKREELRQIRGSVTSLRRLEDGMIQLELDNGQVWRQQDADVRLTIETGDEVTIARAALGTFRLADKSGRFARVKRVR